MSERIIDMPDECLYSWQDIYYPDERDEPMPVRERVVRCKDCYFSYDIECGFWCDRFDCGKEHVTPDGYCAWGERRDA